MRLTFKRVIGLLTVVSPVRMEALRRVEHKDRNQNTQVQSVSEKDAMRGCVFCTTMKGKCI